MSKTLRLGVLSSAVILAAVLLAAPTFAAYTRDLTVGSTGTDVTDLQNFLISKSAAMWPAGQAATGYFGPITQAALAKYQTSVGISPAAGYFGPITRAHMASIGQTGTTGTGTTTEALCPNGMTIASNCMTAPAGATGATCPNGNLVSNNCMAAGTTGLSGTVGSITINGLSTYSAEQVGEGETDQKVIAFEIEAGSESDIELVSMQVEAFQISTGDDRDMDAYMKDVSIWLGSTEVGRDNVSAFSEPTTNDFQRNMVLSGARINAGETKTVYIAVSSLDNIDTGDSDTDDWAAGVATIRFRDGSGVTTTNTYTLDLTDNVVDDTIEQQFDFGSLATVASVELEVSLNTADDEINEAHLIKVNAGASDTNDIELLSFKMKAEGSALQVTEVPVTLTVTGGSTTESDIFKSAHLYREGVKIGSETVADGGAVTFDNLDFTIAKNDTEDFKILVDIQDIDGNLTVGDTLQAQITATNVNNITVEDSSGQQLSDDDATGTALAEASEVRVIGFDFSLISATASITSPSDGATAGSRDTGTYTIKFNLTAWGGDISIDRSCEEADADTADQGIEFTVTNNASNTSTCTFASTADDNTDDTGAAWLISETETNEFTLTVALQPSTEAADDHFSKVYLTSINWDDVVTDTSPDIFTTAGLGEADTSTPELFLQAI
ncbi:MAG: peptidoglycan-binding protein [Candidatus Colwellbacteria bacterium]|nr:peptidoglycan-binding protein [Candidatus Colwellbacteria bacterium]